MSFLVATAEERNGEGQVCVKNIIRGGKIVRGNRSEEVLCV